MIPPHPYSVMDRDRERFLRDYKSVSCRDISFYTTSHAAKRFGT